MRHSDPDGLVAQILEAIGIHNTALYPFAAAFHGNEWWINIEVRIPRKRFFEIETHHPIRSTALRTALNQTKKRLG